MNNEDMKQRLSTAIANLEALRKQIGDIEHKELSEAQFANRFLPFSAATYCKLQTPEKYGAKLDSMTAKCEEAADKIAARIEALQKRAASDAGFVKTRFAVAALGAWQKAQDDEDTRVVVLLGPTGSGKSAIGRHMAAKLGAVHVEGRQSWQSSYKAFCRAVAAAAKSPVTARDIDECYAETAMLEALGQRAGTLYIDEANTMGPFTANGIKLIANQTLHTVVIAAIPEMWDQFCSRSTNEVKQVLNRTQAVIRFDRVTEAEAKIFMAGCGLPDADLPAACRAVCEAANEAGAYKLVRRAAAWLRDQDEPAIADVEKAIRLVRAGLDEIKNKSKK